MHLKFSELSNTFLDFTQIFYPFLKKSHHKPYLGLSCGHFGTIKLKIKPFLRLWGPPEGEFLKWFWGKNYNCAADDRVSRQHFNWFPHNCTSLRKSEMKNLSIFIHGVLRYIASKITSCYLNTLYIFIYTKVRLLVYRPHSHKKIAQSFYKVCILTGNTAQTSSISSKIAHFIKTLGNFFVWVRSINQ